MRTRRVLSVAAGAVALVLSVAAPALAAPQRLGSDPEPGTELHTAPDRVTIQFSEPLDDSSEIHILDECDNRLDGGGTTVELNEMSVGVEKTPSGTYVVQYLAAGVTGTTTESFTFTVLHDGPTCDGSTPGEHDGHGNNDEGDGKKSRKDHGGHQRGQREDHEGMNDHSSGESSSGDHGGGDHSMGGGQGDDHGDRNNKHTRHGNMKHGQGKHAQNNENPGRDAGHETLAAPGDLIPADIPDGTTVLVALGLASVFGALGGWVLRVSGP